MGRRARNICATVEAPIHDAIKQAYLSNDERSTHLIFRKFRNTARVGKSQVSDRVAEILADPNAEYSDVAALVAGAKGREVLETGDISRGVFWAGQSQGLVEDIPTVRALLDRIEMEAVELINSRLAKLISAP